LDKLIEQWTTGYSDIEVMEKLQAVGVPAMPSLNAEELFHNPHLQERQCWTKHIHPVLEEQTVLGSPWKLSLTPPVINKASPLLGEHTRQVFKELIGLTDDEITALEVEEVIS
jgi:crotonobetainyl-CoA:carnitine CoA-transferase CaiB-like acyl-CoA transferase